MYDVARSGNYEGVAGWYCAILAVTFQSEKISAPTALGRLVQRVNLYEGVAARIIESPHDRGVVSR